MTTNSLLYKTQYEVNDDIKILVPKVGDILDNEDTYYSLINILTAMPVDMLVLLDEVGVDFTKINEYDLFLLMFDGIKGQDTSLIFGDLDLGKFVLDKDNESNEMFLVDVENNIAIDRFVQARIAAILRKIHHLTKNQKVPANEEARRYMIRRAKQKAKRNKNLSKDSYLESLIIAMVNTEQYKYSFEETRNLSIYQFNESVLQTMKKVRYSQQMQGVYAGTIDADKLSQDDLNWLVHK